MADVTESIRVKVVGLGHSLELKLPNSVTIAEIKTEIETVTRLPPAYQRILFRGKAFTNGSQSAAEAGIVDRTKLMLVHSQEYSRDSVAAESLAAVALEIDELEAKVLSAPALEEMTTQLLIKLDGIETGDSATLRELRRAQIRRVERLPGTSGEKG